jgi:hypothetical protein
MTTSWVTVSATDVRPGDHIRLPSGGEMDVARVDTPFLGQTSLVCFVEDTATRWLAQPVPTTIEVEVRRDQ